MERIFFGYDFNLLQLFVSRVDIHVVIALLETYGKTRYVFFMNRHAMASCMGASCVEELFVVMYRVSMNMGMLNFQMKYMWTKLPDVFPPPLIECVDRGWSMYIATEDWIFTTVTAECMLKACEKNYPGIVRYFYADITDIEINPLERPLHIAIESGAADVIEFLLHPSRIVYSTVFPSFIWSRLTYLCTPVPIDTIPAEFLQLH